MKLTQMFEMAAAKTCEKCGKTMAANHYWYKGGWKCKAVKPDAAATPAVPPAEQPNAEQPDQPVTPKQTPGTMPLAPPKPKEDPAKPQQDEPKSDVVAQPLTVEVEIIAEVMPMLEAELAKINKTAAKVGANPITTEVIKTEFRDKTKKVRSEFGEEQVIKYKQKFLTIKLTGTTPRIQAADGTTWNFIGVITPSAQGKALLKLTPSAEETEALRSLHSANPYYCDYCQKIRQRNETFIIQNGTQYRQVGRNCLKDFVGGADPHAILQFFSWFQTPEALQARLTAAGGDGEEGFGGRGFRGAQYYTPEEILATTFAVLEVRGGYVSSKAENGRSTASDVRFAFWGQIDRYTAESERIAVERIRALMNDPTMLEKAKKVIEWFKTIPKNEIEANTFFQNVNTMIEEDAVESKMIGYIVGLYPAYQRGQQQNSEKSGGPRLIKDWPEEWGTTPKPVENEHAVVKFVRNLSGAYGVTQLINMMLDNGLGVTWKYSGNNTVAVGDEFQLTGELQPDDYTTPPRVKFVANRKWLRSAFKD